MRPIKAKMDFYYKDNLYVKGDEIKVETKEELVRLNEKGFIEPISYKEIQDFGKESKKKNEEE